MKDILKRCPNYSIKQVFQHLLALSLILSLVFGLFIAVQAQNPKEDLSQASLELLRQNLFLKKLREQLNFATNYYKTLDREIRETGDRIDSAKAEIDSLSDQIALINREITISGKKIQQTQKDIASKEYRIETIYKNIDQKEVEILEDKRLTSDYAKFLYLYNKRFSDTEDNTLNIVKVLLTDESLSSTLQEETYLEILEDTGKEVLLKLQEAQKSLNREKEDLSVSLSQLHELQKQLEDEKLNLVARKEGKEMLLQETQGKEEIYQELLAESIQQEEEVLQEIQALRSNIQYFNERVSSLRDTVTPQEYEQILRIKEGAVNTSSVLQDGQMLRFNMWPVNPRLGISAYFSDSNYKKAFGVDHGAVDIPVSQGTPVLAPANGLVVKVRDTDTGYNYVVLAHERGVMTLYGHLSEISVDIGDFLHEGDILGLSGGIPGTRGAGLRTTGAHVHFEVFQDGVRVDPLSYLPLSPLPDEYIPASYKKQLEEEVNQLVEKFFGEKE